MVNRIFSSGIALLLSVLSVFPCTVKAEDELRVSAESAVLIEAESGEILFEKNCEQRLPMASTTKIMTALVVIEQGNTDRVVEVAPEAVGVEGSSMYLKAGEKLTVKELLYGLMLESANDAATALAYSVSGGTEEFAALMNERARKLGTRNTHFTNPHGLDDEEHYTTAHDLAMITREAMKNELFCEIVSTHNKTVPLNGEEGIRSLVNHNRLLKTYEGAVGVKTGFTKRSGRCLVSAAERGGVRLIAVTLNAPNDWEDHKRMLDLGFDTLERISVAEPRQIFYDLPVVGGVSPSVRCSNRDFFSAVLPKGSRVVTRIEADRYFPAPVNIGDALARAVFYADGEEIGSIPLFAEHSVAESDEKPSLFERILRLFGR